MVSGQQLLYWEHSSRNGLEAWRSVDLTHSLILQGAPVPQVSLGKPQALNLKATAIVKTTS